MFENEGQKSECLEYIDAICASSKSLRKQYQLDSPQKIGKRNRADILRLLKKEGNFISQHHHAGMQIRNVMRQSGIFPPEEELPEHFYDSVWTLALLNALQLTKKEYDDLCVAELYTSNNEATRHVGWCLKHLYGAKYA